MMTHATKSVAGFCRAHSPMPAWLAALAACTVSQVPLQARAAEPSAMERILSRQRGEMATVATVAVPRRTEGRVSVGMPAAFRTVSLSYERTPNIFGSIALPLGRTRMDGRWRRAEGARLRTMGGVWTAMLNRQRGRSAEAQLAAVNGWVNARIAFTPDGRASGRADSWADAAETLRTRRGDCEDYAIAKLQLLRLLGFADTDLYLVIAHDMVRRQDHALLVVRTQGTLRMLDNGTDQLLDARAMSDYRPILTFSGTRAWTHGYAATQRVQFAARSPIPIPIADPS